MPHELDACSSFHTRSAHQRASNMSSAVGKALFLLPACFVVGVVASDWMQADKVCCKRLKGGGEGAASPIGSQRAAAQMSPLLLPLPQMESAIVAKRVAQRLGTWTPPPLTPDERARLEGERAALQSQIAALQERLAARERRSGNSGSNGAGALR